MEITGTEDDRPMSERSTAELLREAAQESKTLAQREIALAREEVRTELKQLERAAVAFGVALATTILASAMFLVAIVDGLDRSSLAAAILGLVLVLITVVVVVLGVRAWPNKPLDRTRHRLETDLQRLKESAA